MKIASPLTLNLTDTRAFKAYRDWETTTASAARFPAVDIPDVIFLPIPKYDESGAAPV